jgi:peptide/nickel transport system substrate-binding protein
MRARAILALIGTAVMVLSILMGASAAQGQSTSQIKKGGSMTILLVGTVWPQLDPATDPSDAADSAILNAIYGQLFEMGPHGTYVPDLATGYSYSDHNLLLTIKIRTTAKFSDGEHYTAAAVAASIERDLLPANACICASNFKDVTSVTSSGSSVQLHLATPSATILEAIIGEAPDWTVPPQAFASTPAATFDQNPIGAGPFKIVSNSASAQIVLAKNSSYWNKPYPILDSVTYQNVSSDTSAYAALQSGEAQAETGITTVSIIQQAQAASSQFKVQKLPGAASFFIEFNTLQPPFNNILARQAVYYATNPKLVIEDAAPGFAVATEEGITASDSFYEKVVPHYMSYNLSKAESLVHQLGGLSFNLVFNTTAQQLLIGEALENEYAQAGITLTITPGPTATEVGDVISGKFQTVLGEFGNFDPDVGILGAISQFASNGTLSGVKDPTLDGLLNQSEQLVGPANRQKVFDKIYSYLNQHAYAPFVLSSDTAVISAKNLVGYTLITGPTNEINLEFVGYK